MFRKKKLICNTNSSLLGKYAKEYFSKVILGRIVLIRIVSDSI